MVLVVVFFFKQKTAYEMRISDWSSDVCSSDREPGDDAGEDDQRHAVADAALSHLLAHPHQEHRACGQRDHRRHDETHARAVDRLDAAGGPSALQRAAYARGPEDRQTAPAEARPLGAHAATGHALLLDRPDYRQSD